MTIDHVVNSLPQNSVQIPNRNGEKLPKQSFFLQFFIKTIRTYVYPASTSEEFKTLCTVFVLKLLLWLSYMLIAIRLVERLFGTLESFLLPTWIQSQFTKECKPTTFVDQFYNTRNKKANAVWDVLLYRTANGFDKDIQYNTDTFIKFG